LTYLVQVTLDCGLERRDAKTRFTLTLDSSKDEFEFTCRSADRIGDRAAIFDARFHLMLRALFKERLTAVPISDISVLLDEDWQAVAKLNETKCEMGLPGCIHDVILEQAELTGLDRDLGPPERVDDLGHRREGRHPRLQFRTSVWNLQLYRKDRIHPFRFALDVARRKFCLVGDLNDRSDKRAIRIRIHLHPDFTAELTVSGSRHVDLRWLKADGTVQKTLPARVKQQHAATLAEIKEVGAGVKGTLAQVANRLDTGYLSNKRLAAAPWQFPAKSRDDQGINSPDDQD